LNSWTSTRFWKEVFLRRLFSF